MAEGASEAYANAALSAVVQGTPYAVPAPWVQFHIGPPGADGTANPAAETRRLDASGCFGVDPANGSVTNDAIIGPLATVAATEVWTHWTLWDDETAGTFWFSGVVSGGGVNAGDDVPINPGQLTLSQPTAS